MKNGLNYTIKGIKMVRWMKIYLKGYKIIKIGIYYTLLGINLVWHGG
jgi:hypothetical protein